MNIYLGCEIYLKFNKCALFPPNVKPYNITCTCICTCTLFLKLRKPLFCGETKWVGGGGAIE